MPGDELTYLGTSVKPITHQYPDDNTRVTQIQLAIDFELPP
jgi:hypothetical protein